VQKGMGTLFHTTKMYGKIVPTRSHPTTTLVIWQVQYAETIGWDLRVYGSGLGSGLMVKV